MRRTLAILALAAVAACASPPPEPDPAPAPPPPPASPAPEPESDTCGASQVRHLVGRPRSEIPVPVDPSRQRVACTTCPVTQDYSPGRLNFFFDAETGIIREIRCG